MLTTCHPYTGWMIVYQCLLTSGCEARNHLAGPGALGYCTIELKLYVHIHIPLDDIKKLKSVCGVDYE